MATLAVASLPRSTLKLQWFSANAGAVCCRMCGSSCEQKKNYKHSVGNISRIFWHQKFGGVLWHEAVGKGVTSRLLLGAFLSNNNFSHKIP
jgi:hypothetical protein